MKTKHWIIIIVSLLIIEQICYRDYKLYWLRKYDEIQNLVDETSEEIIKMAEYNDSIFHQYDIDYYNNSLLFSEKLSELSDKISDEIGW